MAINREKEREIYDSRRGKKSSSTGSSSMVSTNPSSVRSNRAATTGSSFKNLSKAGQQGVDVAKGIIGDGLERLSEDADVQDVLRRKKKIADEGIGLAEREQMRSRMAQQMSQAQQLAGFKLGGALGGAKGAGVAAQQRSLAAQGLAARAGIESDIFMAAEAAKRQGLESYSKSLGEVKTFDIGQAAKERDITFQSIMGYEQMASAERAAQLEADAARKSADAQNQGTVLCTAAYQSGHLPAHIYDADSMYGKQSISEDTLKGYQYWATPLTKIMINSKTVKFIMMPLIKSWAYHIAYLMGSHDKPNVVGSFLLKVGAPICSLIGKLIRRK